MASVETLRQIEDLLGHRHEFPLHHPWPTGFLAEVDSCRSANRWGSAWGLGWFKCFLNLPQGQLGWLGKISSSTFSGFWSMAPRPNVCGLRQGSWKTVCGAWTPGWSRCPPRHPIVRKANNNIKGQRSCWKLGFLWFPEKWGISIQWHRCYDKTES